MKEICWKNSNFSWVRRIIEKIYLYLYDAVKNYVLLNFMLIVTRVNCWQLLHSLSLHAFNLPPSPITLLRLQLFAYLLGFLLVPLHFQTSSAFSFFLPLVLSFTRLRQMDLNPLYNILNYLKFFAIDIVKSTSFP